MTNTMKERWNKIDTSSQPTTTKQVIAAINIKTYFELYLLNTRIIETLGVSFQEVWLFFIMHVHSYYVQVLIIIMFTNISTLYVFF